MHARGRLFKNGGSQAVRLPKDFRFPEGQREVVVRRRGRQIILEPLDEWPASFLDALGAWDEALERPQQTVVGATRDPLA